METTSINGSTRFSTAGGFLTIFFLNIHSGDILKTMILSAVGASVSFFMSLIWKRAVNLGKKKSTNTLH